MARPPRTPMVLSIDAILAFDGNQITDHNRRPVSVSYSKFQNEKRMVDAMLRRFVVAEKRTWKVSWEDLPTDSEYVFEGFWAGEDIRSFYEETPGEFYLTLTYGPGETEEVLVMFDSFNYSVSKRTVDFDFWDVDLSIVEV